MGGGGAHAPPLQRHKTRNLRNVNLVWAVPRCCVAGGGRLAPPLLRHKTTVLRRVAGEGLTADMSAVWHSRHVYCVTQQTMSAV